MSYASSQILLNLNSTNLWLGLSKYSAIDYNKTDTRVIHIDMLSICDLEI